MSTRLITTRLATLLALPLAAQDQTMKEVVVSASGFQQEKKQAPASITVITRKEIERIRANHLADLLRDVEGLDVNAESTKTGGMSITLRGMPSDYTLVLIDGRRQNPAGNVTPNGFNDSATSFLPPPAAIERIEIIRGPMSTLYGSDAMGGVINIITRKVAKAWTGQVSLDTTHQLDPDYGDTRSATLYAAGPLVADRFGLQLKGKVLRRDASSLTWPGMGTTEGRLLTMGTNPVKSDIGNLGTRLSFTPSRSHDLVLDVDQSRTVYDNARGQMGTLDTDKAKSGYLPELKFNRAQTALTHTWRLEAGQLETNLSRNTTETIGRTIPDKTPGKVAGSPRTLESINSLLDTKLVTQLGPHQLTTGAQYWDADMTDGVAAGRYEKTQWGLFTEDEWQLHKDLTLTLGLRHDHHDSFGGKTTPRAYLVWHADARWTLKGGLSFGYKTPRLDQLFEGVTGYGAQGTLPVYGNADLKPETSISKELGALFQEGTWSGGLTLFQTDFRNAIGNETYVAPGTTVAGIRPINFSEAEIRGAEATTTVKPTASIKLSLNYTHTWSERQGGTYYGGVPFTLTPRHMLNLKGSWAVSSQVDAWLQGEYRSSRFRTEDTAGTNVKARLGNYRPSTLVHLGGAYRFNRAFTLQATVYNLLNRSFLEYEPVTVSAKPAFANRHYTNQEPRRLWVSAAWTF